MKNFLLILLLLPIITFSQTPDFPRDENGKVLYTEVVNVDGASASTLFSRAKLFAATKYADAKKAIDLTDEEAKRIVCKSTISSYFSNFKILGGKGFVNYTLTVEAKDNKFRYVINEIMYEEKFPDRKSHSYSIDYKQDSKTYEHWPSIQRMANGSLLVLAKELKEAMANKADDNW